MYCSTFARRVLAMLSALVPLITGQDAQTAFFPSDGNGSTSELDGKIEPAIRPEMTEPAAASLVPNNYFFPVRGEPQRTYSHYRSDPVPYYYEQPLYGYPMSPHYDNHEITPAPRHLVIVSFIGLLLLFAILQNTIAALKRKEVVVEHLASREKRELYTDFNSVTPEEEIVLNDDARVRCIQRTICLESRKLLRDLGTAGKKLAKYLTRAVKKSVKSSPGWDRLVGDAGAAGLREEDCNVLYRDCFTPISAKHKGSEESEGSEN